MKKLINDPDEVVARRSRAWRPRTATWSGSTTTRLRSSAPTRPCRARSGSISGGGSGHEPMHGGFVGPGMLDARVPRRGVHLADARPDARGATKAVDGGAGVLHIVKNYTGDVLNFEMAADLAKGEGIEVEAVVIERRRRGRRTRSTRPAAAASASP